MNVWILPGQQGWLTLTGYASFLFTDTCGRVRRHIEYKQKMKIGFTDLYFTGVFCNLSVAPKFQRLSPARNFMIYPVYDKQNVKKQ